MSQVSQRGWASGVTMPRDFTHRERGSVHGLQGESDREGSKEVAGDVRELGWIWDC